MSAKDVKWAARNIGRLTSKSSLLASINMKVMTSLQEGTLGRLNGLSLKLNVGMSNEYFELQYITQVLYFLKIYISMYTRMKSFDVSK